MTVEIHPYNHLSFHKASIFYYIIGLAVLYYLRFSKPAVVIFGIWWAVDLIPAIYLHIEYWLKNKGERYEIKADELIRYKDGQEERYRVEDIGKVIIYKSASMDRGGIPFLAVESYYYARVLLKSNKEIILTRLLTSKLEVAVRKLQGVKHERRKRLFNTLVWK